MKNIRYETITAESEENVHSIHTIPIKGNILTNNSPEQI